MKATTFELLRMGFVPVRWKGGNAGAALGMEIPNVAEAHWVGGNDWLVSPYQNAAGEYPTLRLEGLRDTLPEPYALSAEVLDFGGARRLSAPGGFFEVPATRQYDEWKVTSLWMSRGGSVVEVVRTIGWPLGWRVLRVENAGDLVEFPLWGAGSGGGTTTVQLINEYELRSAELVFEGFRPTGRNPYTGEEFPLREKFPEGCWLSEDRDLDNYVAVFRIPNGGRFSVRDAAGGPRPELGPGTVVRMVITGETLAVTSVSPVGD